MRSISRGAAASAAALLVACQGPPPSPPKPSPPAAGAASAAPPKADEPRWIDDASPVGISPFDPSWGPPGAPVTVVRATALGDKDYLLRPAFRQWLAATFGGGNTRLVWLPFYVNNVAGFAALGCAANALAGQPGFWSLVDALGAYAESGAPEAEFERWAAGAGVSGARVEEAMGSPRCQQGLLARAKQADKLFDAYGATTFVNGVRSYAVSYADAAAVEASLGPVIEAEMAAAKAALAKGVAPGRLYVERSTENVERAAYASGDPARPVLDTTTRWRASVGDGPTKGPGDALVTAVLYCAPMNPVCRWVYDRAQALVPKHSLRFALRPYEDKLGPCDVEATTFAAQAAAEKGPPAYYEALDALHALQPKISVASDGSGDTTPWNDAVRAGQAPVCTPAALRAAAGKVGVRYDAYAKRLQARGVAAGLKANRAEGDALDGDTALFVNGRRLGFLGRGEPAPALSEAGIEAFLERVVAEEEAAAREKVKRGADPKKLYESLTREGYVKR